MVRRIRPVVCYSLALSMVLSPVAASAQQRATDSGQALVDLGYVTPGAVAAAVAYPRRVLTAPELEMMPIEILSAVIKKELGFDPLDVDRLLAVAEPPGQGPPGLGVVIQLNRAYPLATLKLPAPYALEPGEIDGRPYRQPAEPGGFGLFMPDDRTLIVATDPMLRAMLRNKRSPAEGPVSRLIAQTRLTADATVLAVLEPVRPLLAMQLSSAPLPPALADVRRLPELIEAAQVELTVTGQPSSSLSLLATSDEKAAELETLVQALMQTGQQMALAELDGQMGQSDDPVQQAGAAYTRRMVRRTFEMFQPTRKGRTLVMSQEGAVTNQMALNGVLVALLLPAVQAAREAARRAQSMNNLKQIAVAMHLYQDRNKVFPPRASLDDDRKPLLSWRVHLLPFLDQEELYREFRLDEPWDSPHNQRLVDRMPPVYRNPSAGPSSSQASYLVPAGPGAIFEDPEGTSLTKIRDGAANTVLVLEVNDEESVVWTKPEDYVYSPDQPLAGLGRAHPSGFCAAMADGSVRYIAASIDPELFLLLLKMADGNQIPRQF